ncbi:N-6 DNA methylase [Spiroplasma endosymbiont of Polydrusus pterygomalis]|uniref:type I restriction-modification system subunit M n=1 Tax=Spiroplasma endosymbiont of Polydrusus pterygomalis TaxID=3139327 RepID=UPI003CCA8931
MNWEDTKMTPEELKNLENTLWKSADKLRGSIDASNYKDVVLGLIFLKYISDKFEIQYQKLKKKYPHFLNDLDFFRDYCSQDNVFWVPEKARWEFIAKQAHNPEIKTILDQAFSLIEKENEELKGILPKTYTKTDIDYHKLSGLIDLFTNQFPTKMTSDLLGLVYEYFLGEFARNSGKKGGEFYTPTSIVKLLVSLIEPYSGRVYDPACGSGGMFVQAEKFITSHGGNQKEISIYGQELNATTWRLAKMNLAIRGISANLGATYADTFLNDQHKDQDSNIDFILANPPFNMSDYGIESLLEDYRWKGYAVPPKGNANYAWILHMISKLNQRGVAAIILANGSLSTTAKSEFQIRKQMLQNNLVECIISLPDKLFYTTGIPVSIWIIRRNKKTKKVLFINATDFGEMIDRKLRILNATHITEITSIYHNWKKEENYDDNLGINKSVDIEAIIEKNYSLVPGMYVGYKSDEKSQTELKQELKTTT